MQRSRHSCGGAKAVYLARLSNIYRWYQEGLFLFYMVVLLGLSTLLLAFCCRRLFLRASLHFYTQLGMMLELVGRLSTRWCSLLFEKYLKGQQNTQKPFDSPHGQGRLSQNTSEGVKMKRYTGPSLLLYPCLYSNTFFTLWQCRGHRDGEDTSVNQT